MRSRLRLPDGFIRVGVWLWPLAIAGVVGLTGLTVQDGVPAVPNYQLEALDQLFIRDSGPHLGYRPPDSRLVVVSIWPTGETRSAQDDVALYQKFLAAGAKVIVDYRYVQYTSGPSDGDSQKLELVSALRGLPGARGHVIRAQMPPAALDPGDRNAYFAAPPLGFQDALKPGATMVDTDLALRYYPIFGAVTPNGNTPKRPDIIETAAVRAARYALGGSPDDDPATLAATAGALGQPDYTSGELFPAPGSGPDRSYQLGRFQTPWVRRPFRFDESTGQDVSEAAIRIAYTAAPGAYPTITPKGGDIFTDCGVYCASQSPVQVAPDFYRGKILLVEDATCYGISQDCVFTPTSTSKQATAQDLDAAVISQLIRGQALRSPPWSLETVGLFLAALLGTFLLAGLGPLRGALTAPVVLAAYLVLAVGEYRAGWMPDLIVIPAAFVVASVASGAYRYALSTLERHRVVDLFGRYVARSVVAQLIKGGSKPVLGGEARDVTVVFADVRGFTRWSASLPPAQVVAALNKLLAAMVSVAFRHDATVDKYIGDAVMLLFNAPLDQPDHVERALRTAAEMQLSAVGTGLEIGIGVNCGEAVVGNIGTPDRVEYTAIGRTVNLAARLCDNARPGEILVSDEVRRRLGDTVALVAREPLRLKGFDEPVQTYAVVVAEKE